MNGKWLTIVVLTAVAGLLLGLNSCGHDQRLVSIQIQPTVENVGATNIPVPDDHGFQVQLRALGTYIHPPVTKDITNQVTWASNTIQMFTVDSTGLLTATGEACGGTLVSATANTNTSDGGLSSSGAVVTGYMTANVICYTGGGGGGGGGALALTLTFAGLGAGTVTSSPSGLSCASSAGVCAALFPANSVVTLTATPSGSSAFGGWSNCSTPASTNPCMVTVSSDQAVVVTFN
ncbi:MAG: hypothetical protein ACLPHP_24215 [Candidatus Sulfotelmatobacter sp.]